ncbi:iron dicitrate transport regulator FecR [Acidovorax sp. ACV01]|uniref:iron dicitrate transport regulator FecR n=1 Tax=Acidovorax sp. ACV01 TaxID=2769311 RepID=UPI001783911B|nr:iron dicitrate transport regulator FecR [Acidovorax sp. ACV01]MBD9392025.1 iron dicitrate transport regulator FecR [Acidovorax sp. ACV01]
MTHHPHRHPTLQLLGRTEEELLWHRRRSLLQAATAWMATGGWVAAQAQSGSNIVEVRGDVLRNGQPLTARHSIAAGDRIETGPGSTAVFTVGNSAFMLRQNTRMALEGDTPTAVKILRVLTGAVASVWGQGTEGQVILPTATAGIRGTGVYAEVFPELAYRGYFCNCYGTVDLAAGSENIVSQSVYHQSFWAEPAPRDGRLLTPAGAINHTDEELEFLASLVGQRTAWQIAGRKGTKDGSGQMSYPSAPGGSAPTAPPAPASPALPPPTPAPLPPAPVSRARPPSPYGADY